MKFIVNLLFLSALLGFVQVSFPFQTSAAAETNAVANETLKEIWFQEDEFSDSASIEAELQNDAFGRASDIDNLLRAKFKMINGDLKLAKFYLSRIDERKSRVASIKKRYEATIAFIEGRYQDSVNDLSSKSFYDNSLYSEICLLKLINYMAVNDVVSLEREKTSCMSATGKTSKNDQYWLDTMIKLKLNDRAGVKKNLLTYGSSSDLSEAEMGKLWLKTGLYLNKEKDILALLANLPESSYQSKRLREIIAFMYLRSGNPADKARALSFVDDIDSANAENIKGNINLSNNEYELAFGHFRLALQKKQDSTNSLERAIPLAWLLNQWKDGLSMLLSNTNKGIDPRNKAALQIAFLIREKQFALAQLELAHLKIEFQQKPPLEVNIMDSYVSLMTSVSEKKSDKKIDLRSVEESTEAACRSFDGISCWISLQFIHWENLGKTIKRDDTVFSDKEMTLDSLKEKKPVIALKETISVDQKDIEELDGQSIQLIKLPHN
jgi:hypothetical protein